MKRLISFCVFIISLFFSNTCFSQKNNFSPGFFINQNGDTLNGVFNVKYENRIFTFNFKKTLNDPNSIKVSFDTCKELTIGTGSFVNWLGKRSMTYIDKFDLSIKNENKFVTGLIPLRLLFKGNPLSLFYYNDEFDHFFVKKGDTIVELTVSYKYTTEWEKRSYAVNSPTYIINPAFRNQIIAIMNNNLTKKQLSVIENLEYDKSSLIRLFKSINSKRK